MIVVIIIALILGIVLGRIYSGAENISQQAKELSYYSLLLLLFLVGLEVGQNRQAWTDLRRLGARALLLPASVIVGSLSGGLIAGLILGFSVFESLSLSSGMGYYSLSSIMLRQSLGAEIGIQALITDISREILTFVLTPLLVRWSFLYPITLGGATVMDTTLPVITRYTSATNTVLAIISGGVVTVAVPLLLELFGKLAAAK